MNIRPLTLTLCPVFALALAAPVASSTGPSSTNYAIAWDVFDSGGGSASSTNYRIVDTVGQPTPAGVSTSASYTLSAGFQSPPDFDEDGVRNFMDNCLFEANGNQRDTNADGFGNICDPDLNDDLAINAVDLGILKSRFFTADPDADFNGDGFVNPVDLGIMKARFFTAPGPSGIAP